MFVQLFTALALSQPAAAGTLTETLADARAALVAKDSAAAIAAVDEAAKAAVGLEALAAPVQLSQVWYFRGVAQKMAGNDAAAVSLWRNALVLDNSLPWDEELLADGPTQDLFEALRAEVRDRPRIDAQVPEQTGAAKAYVDGQRLRFGEGAAVGIHLAQIQCPDETVYGQWSDFQSRMKWLKMCPGGVDTSVVVEEEEEEDDFGDFGPAFGEGAQTAAAGPGPDDGEPLVGGPASPVVGKGPMVQRKITWPLIAAGGGVLVGSGVAYAVANSRRNAFDDPANTEITTPGEVDAAAKKVNSAGWLSVGLGVTGVGLCVAGVIPW